jgi:outer membrane lipoprotein-sorting protein
MMKSIFIAFLIGLAIFSAGCGQKENNRLEKALLLAGENRTE